MALALGYGAMPLPRRCCFNAASSSFNRVLVVRAAARMSAAQETLEVLEWKRLSSAVSSFASTALGRQRLQVLELPSTESASEMLLSETHGALEFEALRGNSCDLGAIQTDVVKVGLTRASKGVALSGREAAALAAMLEAARSLRHAAFSSFQENKEKQEILRPIYDMLCSIDADVDTTKTIWNAVNDDGSVKDSASPELRTARMEQASCERKLQELMTRIVIDRLAGDPNGQVASLDGRLCVAVSTENSSKVPGLLLQSSAGGLVSYVEPSAAVALNNSLSQARADAAQAEYRVLDDLTTKLRPSLSNFSFTLDIVADFDVVLARGRYSSSIGATRPSFVHAERDESESTLDEFLVLLEGARHPLLLEQHRGNLREAKVKLNTKRKILNRMKSRAFTSAQDYQAAEEAITKAEEEVAELEASAPVPIDFLIKRETKVVTITGPNTGGKTAAIKTLGLAVLMARAGLYVLAKEPALIPWVDRVLADIGDQQSLSQSLSTFSGHLLRIKRIKEESTSSSLVLLDEVGTGTDFVEGAALGMAMLESFAAGSLLTLATTHHGELKMLKYSDDRFENASVEFDEEKLKPTYRLLWGLPGRSNALNIAARLGLPEEIIMEARSLHGAANAELNEVIMTLEQARQKFEHDLSKSQKLLGETKRHYRALSIAQKEIEEYRKTAALDANDQLAVAEAAARSDLNKLYHS
ncbi:uncharacterized protein LOC9634579 [Selaginella moellendorffii]|uniref:uncharacterized protein LOC9634579 n=1 Tax=Selaginella moellendorffii TaxID=88036 RepID=UPI000D1CBE2F|nr:uncharacterized protein LOC9634579 [Selaginella moellendorffii]|eukprot:XP_024542747.1 uncharacterized protein LOC9634579 [Selaginella moellendorffii]